MKNRIISLLLVLTSLIGYMEWGTSNKIFLYQIELDLIKKICEDPLSLAHPLIVFPILGQLLLLLSIAIPKRGLILSGTIGLAILFILILLAGALSKNVQMIGSTLPFLGLAIYNLKSLFGSNRSQFLSRISYLL